MKGYIGDIIDKSLPREDNENRLREYIQKYLLFILYRKKFYYELIFTGGTALRFLYKLRRFSEDLDFSLSKKARNYDFLKMLEILKKRTYPCRI
ncbi:MAG: nucleotidyl transferase AbiEii/AbiGii toxin family protein [candidate division WOR-3 bacterium]|nr:nucleotidyl transferase AbiEii/AbiGii toxin family protein [candidate division WOR-3 bacterium]